MTLFWIGAGLLVLGAAGFLVMFANSDYNTALAPPWATAVGIAGVVAIMAGVVSVAVSITGWLT